MTDAQEAQAIAAINAVIAPVVYVLLAALTLAMVGRLIRHWRSGRKAPLLLLRDAALFVALLVLIGGGQFARITGAKLGNELWWVLLTDALSVAVLVLWIMIEFAIIGRRDK